MTDAQHPFRIIKKRETGVIYIAISDLLSYFENNRNECNTAFEEELWSREIKKFNTMIFEGLNHDL